MCPEANFAADLPAAPAVAATGDYSSTVKINTISRQEPNNSVHAPVRINT